MKYILLPFVMLLFLINAKSQDIDKRLKGVDAELNEVLKTWNVAGYAVAVVEKDKIIYAKGFGFSDYENKVPATANTLFAIGSCTKSFTSSILGILQDEGKLSLDDSPKKHISELKFFNMDMDNSITIKDMMSHRTGLPRHDFSWYLFPTNSKDSLLRRIEFQEPFTEVRKQWYYNNFMFLAQGVIAERITGKSWEDNIREKFFKPLGMTRSNVSINELKKSKDASLGYELVSDSIIKKSNYYDIAGMSPAGSINSSVNEMSNWIITWINGGKFKGEKIIPEAYASEAISSQMVVGSGLPSKEHPDLFFGNYGYGWFLSSYKGHYRVEHGGNIDGFSASSSFYPSDSIGIVVLVNQNGSAVPSVVRNIISDRMLGAEITDWNKELSESRAKAIKEAKEAEKAVVTNEKTDTKPSHNLTDYTGTYNHPGYGDFKINISNDSLFAEYKLMTFYLNHVFYDVFEPFLYKDAMVDTSSSLGIKYNFQTNNEGEISSVTSKIEAAIEPIVFDKKQTEIKVGVSVLEKYLGEFEIGGMTAKIYLKEDKTTLYLFVPGQPEYELLSLGDNKFSLKIMDGFKLEFLDNGKNEFNEVNFIQPNGTFKAKRKLSE